MLHLTGLEKSDQSNWNKKEQVANSTKTASIPSNKKRE
jgi:hypothetical protein